jgi:hypothetical protein
MSHLDRVHKLIKKEKNVEVLQVWAAHILEENARLHALLKAQQEEEAKKAQTQLVFEEQLKTLRRALFGRSREARPEASDRARDKSQADALVFAQAAFPAPEGREAEKNKSLKDKWKQIPEREIEHELTPEELAQESALRGLENPSATQWEELKNAYDCVTTIQIVERSYEKRIHKKKKYRLKTEHAEALGKDVIVTARGPASLLPGMNYSTEFVASVVADKYISHLPLERQTRQMESLGLRGMRTSTLSRQCAVAAAALEPIAEKIKQELFKSTVALHLDETPWKIQNKEQKDGYMWTIACRLGSYYFFKPSRAGIEIKKQLEGYSGPAVTDGYSGYGVLEEAGIEQGCCWAHARRKFFEIESVDPSVKPILDLIDQLFATERRAKTFEELKALRDAESAVIVEKLKQTLFDEWPNSRPQSAKRNAIEYMTKRWDQFTLFLRDIRVPLSNNEAERTIRHAVMGRKNYYGAATHSGAETAATLFTIVETCKKNEIDPRSYLIMTLRQLAAGDVALTPLEYARSLRSPAA